MKVVWCIGIVKLTGWWWIMKIVILYSIIIVVIVVVVYWGCSYRIICSYCHIIIHRDAAFWVKNEIIIVRNLDKIILQNKLSGYQHDSHNNNIMFQHSWWYNKGYISNMFVRCRQKIVSSDDLLYIISWLSVKFSLKPKPVVHLQLSTAFKHICR